MPLRQRALRRAGVEAAYLALLAFLFREFLFSDKLLYGTDMIPAGLFFRGLLVDFVKQFHEMPRWNPYILGGLPFLDATHGDTWFPTSWLQFFGPVYRALGLKLLVHVYLAGVCMEFYLRTVGLKWRPVAFGRLAYMLTPVLVSYLFAGQDAKMYVTSLAPLALAFTERGMRSGRWPTFLALGVTIGLVILTSHVQMAYHCLWFVGALFVMRLVIPFPGTQRPSPARTVPLFVAAIVIGLGIAAIQLAPAVSYVKNAEGFSVRSNRTDYEHASSWSLHPEEIASMVVPEFCNAPQGYWGRNVFKYNSDYLGVLVMMLAVLGIAAKRDSTRWFLAGSAAFAVLYSLGGHTPIHKLFYWIVPQVKLFRAPPLIMFGASFGVTALAAHGLHDLLEAAPKRKGEPTTLERRVLFGGLVAAGALALIALAARPVTAAWTDLFLPALDAAKRQAQQQNLPVFRNGAFLSAAIVASGAVLLRFARGKGRNANLVLLGLLVVVAVDAWHVDRRFLMIVDPARWTVPQGMVAELARESRQEKFRVAPIVSGMSGNELGYFGIESVFGFHDNELRWYRELREAPEAQDLLAATGVGFPFLRILNVKYVIHDRPGLPNPLPVPDSLPRTRLAGNYEILDRERMPARILEPDFDPARTVLLEESPGFTADPADTMSPGRVTGTVYDGNVITVEVDTTRPALLVHAENWFPYWHAFVDGTEQPILRAYGTLRAVAVPAGRHEIVFRFVSKPYRVGKDVTLATLGIVGLLALVALAAERRRRGDGEARSR